MAPRVAVDGDTLGHAGQRLPGMNISRDVPHLKIRGVGESLGLIPHLLGFHPHESLVIIVIHHGRVAVTARVDLAPLSEPLGVQHLLARLWARFPGADAWFVAYSADADAAWQVLEQCQLFMCPAARSRIIYVDGRSWWADSPESEPEVHDPTATRLAAEATLIGLPARPSRGHLAALAAGPRDEELGALIEIFEREQERLGAVPDDGWPALMKRALRDTQTDPDSLTEEQCATLAILAQHPDARDQALRVLTAETAPREVARWAQVVRKCLLSLQAMPLGLLGLAAWVSGDGALQVVCLERAQQLAPESALVSILDTINAEMLPPSMWAELRSAGLAQAPGSHPRVGSRRAARRRR